MSKLKHTPGPWKISFSSKEIASKYIIDNNGTIITAVKPAMNHTKNVLADARLIAAAPEMLEGLIWFVKRVRSGEVRSKKTYAKFVELIESATGLSIEEVLLK